MARDLDPELHTIPPNRGEMKDQPTWRRDFPVDTAQDAYVARRDFTKFLVLTSLAFAIGQFWIAIQNFFRERRGDWPIQRIAGVDEVPLEGALTFSYPTDHDQCVLVRTSQQSFVAFSRQCTHLSCSVVPEPERGRFYCPCHEGAFDFTTGAPIAGPPRRPLSRIKLDFKQGVIYATGVELRTL